MHVTAIIPAKGTSTRLPNKNLQPFGGSTLVGHKVDQLLACAMIDDVVVASDCDLVLAETGAHGARTLKQDPADCDEAGTPLRDRWRSIVSKVETDLIVWAHCTNPLCTPDIYGAAISAYFGIEEEPNPDLTCDSLCSVTKIQRHAWAESHEFNDFKPANFDPWGGRHPFASELAPYYFQNGAIFIQPRDQMLVNGYFYGERPLLFEIEQPYDLDIDTERDLTLARRIYQGMQSEKPAEGYEVTVRRPGESTVYGKATKSTDPQYLDLLFRSARRLCDKDAASHYAHKTNAGPFSMNGGEG